MLLDPNFQAHWRKRQGQKNPALTLCSLSAYFLNFFGMRTLRERLPKWSIQIARNQRSKHNICSRRSFHTLHTRVMQNSKRLFMLTNDHFFSNSNFLINSRKGFAKCCNTGITAIVRRKSYNTRIPFF